MLELPKRISLAEQAAGSIRKAIDDGIWKVSLPSERRLSDIFKVSRPTIRSAIFLLAKEGLLTIATSRRTRLIAHNGGESASQPSLVCIVTPVQQPRWTEHMYQAYTEMRARLAGHGFITETLLCDASQPAVSQRKIEAYVQKNQVRCFVLLSVPYEMQRWFASRGMPALVVGSCGPAVRLPSFEINNLSTGRHAAGTFVRLGHRRLALLVPDSRRGGDLACEQGFRAGGARSGRRDAAEVVVLRHKDTTSSVLAQLGRAFESATPPTAFLVTIARHAYSLLYFLQRRGLHVPEDVSIISADPDPNFQLVSPTFSHYAFEGDAYSTRLVRLVLKLLREGSLPFRAKLIEQKYIPGETVAAAPDRRAW